MRLGSFTITHVIRLDASPAFERIVERIAYPGPELGAALGDFMATARELLDALRAGVEQTEANRAEVERLRREKAEYEAEEAEEDRLEEIEDEEHAEAIAEFEESRRVDRARIAELEAAMKDGLILTPDEQTELRDLTARLNSMPLPPIP